MKTVSIIGVGRVGGALALAFNAKNKKYRIENLISRNPNKTREIADTLIDKPQVFTDAKVEKIKSDIIFICTQDSEILDGAEKLAEKLNHKPYIFHVSGSLSSEILSDVKNIGCKTGSIHPLVSVSDAFLGAQRFENSYFCVEGEPSAVRLAEKIVEDLNGKSFSIETKHKILYHAAAVTACGHLVAVIDTALEMLRICGLENVNAQKILLPLIKSTIENLETQTTAQALTGTFARADFSTFEKHLEVLVGNVSPLAVEIYLSLGERSLELAEKQGADSVNLEKIRKSISLAKKNLK
ncbi:MAG: F420-dependent NADP oxidoreductase [Acidobacteriota bacterium]|nr:F420-dependent NADP oxidoreductase [Acidobacteriota bacterium]